MKNDDYDPNVSGSAPHFDVEPERERVTVYPPEGQVQATAQALLDKADDPADVVYTDGGFDVPKDLADKVKLPQGDVESTSSAATVPAGEADKASEKAAPRKAAARKSTPRKAAPRKAAGSKNK